MSEVDSGAREGAGPPAPPSATSAAGRAPRGPLVADLVARHREGIDALREACRDLLPPAEKKSKTGAEPGESSGIEAADVGVEVPAASGSGSGGVGGGGVAGAGGHVEAHASGVPSVPSSVGDRPGPEFGPLDELETASLDDVFLLRYVLSFKGSVKKAEAAVRHTFKFREEAMTRVVREKASMGFAAFSDCHEGRLFEGYTAAGWLHNAQVTGGPVMIVRGSLSNMLGIHDGMSKDEYLTLQLSHRELAYRACDRIARRDGVLAKQIIVFDMASVPLSTMTDRRTSDMHAKVSHLSGDVYPQMQEKLIIVNAPSWMAMVVSMFRKILPARAFEKVEMFESPAALWESEWAQETLDRDYMPTFLGGNLPDASLPNYLTGERMFPFHEEIEVNVSARSSKEIRFDLPIAGVVVKYTFMVAAYGVGLRATIRHGGSGVDKCRDFTGKVTELQVEGDDKLKAETGPLRGEWRCNEPGVLLVVLDNSYSMFRSKTVRYHVELEMPDPSKPAAVETDPDPVVAAEATVDA